MSETAFEVDADGVAATDMSRDDSTESAALETSATHIVTKHAVTAEEATLFTNADDFYDDDGPVLDELRNRTGNIFRTLRSGVPFLIKFRDLIQARPRDRFNRLITPYRGFYTYGEIIEDATNRKAVTVRAAFAEFEMTDAVRLQRKLEAQNKRHEAIQAAVSSGTEIVTDSAGNVMSAELTAKVLAQEAEMNAAIAGRNAAVQAAHEDGFADGIYAADTFNESRKAAANTATESFYVVLDGAEKSKSVLDAVNPAYEKRFETLALAQKRAVQMSKHGEFPLVMKVDAAYTFTPCNLELPPSPVKKTKKKKERTQAEVDADLALLTATPRPAAEMTTVQP